MLPSSGLISIANVSVELQRASNYQTSLGDAAVRNLAAIPSGLISLAHLYGKTFSFTATWAWNSLAYMYNGGVWAYYGLEVSGGSWRYFSNWLVGSWITTNSTTAAFTGNSLISSNRYGFETSGTSVRMLAYDGAQTYGAWLTYTIGIGWSTGTSTPSATPSALGFVYQLEGSAGAIRYNGNFSGQPLAYGPWTTLD